MFCVVWVLTMHMHQKMNDKRKIIWRRVTSRHDFIVSWWCYHLTQSIYSMSASICFAFQFPWGWPLSILLKPKIHYVWNDNHMYLARSIKYELGTHNNFIRISPTWFLLISLWIYSFFFVVRHHQIIKETV